MSSRWGSDLPGYREFRTGLTFGDVREMLRASEKHRARHDRPHDRRHTVLGLWHEIKLQLYERARDLGYAEGTTDSEEEGSSSAARAGSRRWSRTTPAGSSQPRSPRATGRARGRPATSA